MKKILTILLLLPLWAFAATTYSTTLTWTAPDDPAVPMAVTSGVAGYNIYQDGKLRESILNSNTGTISYTVNNLAADTGYSFDVRAFDRAGNEAPSSNLAAFTTPKNPDTTPPNRISNLVASILKAIASFFRKLF